MSSTSHITLPKSIELEKYQREFASPLLLRGPYGEFLLKKKEGLYLAKKNLPFPLAYIAELSVLPGFQQENFISAKEQLNRILKDIQEGHFDFLNTHLFLSTQNFLEQLQAAEQLECHTPPVISSNFLVTHLEQLKDLKIPPHQTLKLKILTGLDKKTPVSLRMPQLEREVFLIKDLITRHPQIRLRLDANRSFQTTEEITFFYQELADKIEYFEEPFEDTYLKLDQLTDLPIALDESCVTLGKQLTSFLNKSSHPFSLVLKPSLLGGPLTTLKIIESAQQQNHPVIISSSFEGIVGQYWNRYLASFANGLQKNSIHGLDTEKM